MRNPNGYGSVYKLSGNRRRPWVARITAGWTDAEWETCAGKSKQIYKIIGYFKTRKEAQIALAEYNKDPYDVDLLKLTFKEVFERWSNERFPKVSKSKVNQYKTVFNQSKAIHNIAFSKLRTTHFQSLIDEKSHLKASTLGHHKSTYLQLYKYAIKHEFASKNYAEFIDIPKDAEPRQKARKTFSREEIDTVIANYRAGVPYADVVVVLLFTGFRIMELLKLKKTDVHLADRYIIGGFKSEAGTDRIVPINRKILPIIETWMQRDSEYLIHTPQGCMWLYQNFRPSIWIPLMERMGMNHTAHHTRHTFVSLMQEAGVERVIIQRIVGHSNRDITDHYTHLEIQRLVEAIDAI